MKKIIYITALACISYIQCLAQEEEGLAVRLDSLSKKVEGLNGKVDFTLVDAPLYELLRAVAETHDINVSLHELPQIAITNNFTNVAVKDLFVFLCQEYGLKIRFTNNIFAFYADVLPEPPEQPMVVFDDQRQMVSFNVSNKSLIEFSRFFTEVTSRNLMVSSHLENRMINVYLKDLSLEEALETLAESIGLDLIVKSDRVYLMDGPEDVNTNTGRSSRRVSSGSRSGSRNTQIVAYKTKVGEAFVDVSCENAPVKELIAQACQDLNIDYVFMSEIKGSMDAQIDSVAFSDFVDLCLTGADLTYSVTEKGIYLIGMAQRPGLNSSEVYRFKNRTVEGMQEILPSDLTKTVQIKEFKDLNGFILTGSDAAIKKVTDFLAQVDTPVPNVLIEVIVAEVKKGFSMSTGVQAFLGDSVPNTGGQVFGGVDVTLSTASINKILGNLDARGIMNLGRVTPQFYATLKAMEDNNDMEIQSTPKLSTLNGHEASMRIGQSVYYLVETQNITGGVTSVITTTPRYEQVEANLDLKITPYVSQHEDVTLSIEAEFSDFISPTIEGAPPGNATRKFISKIRVKNGETVVMGGLVENSKNSVSSGVPLLSRIPILKWIFSYRSKEKSESKLIIFVKPTIVY